MTLDELESYEDFVAYLRERVGELKAAEGTGSSETDNASGLPSRWSEEGLALVAVGMIGQAGGAEGIAAVREALVQAQDEADFELFHAVVPLMERGLGPAIALAAVQSGIGASVSMAIAQSQSQVDDAAALFDVSGDAEVFALPEEAIPAVAAAADAEGVMWSRIGTTGGDMLVFTGSDVIADGNGGVPLFLELSEL